MWQTRGENTASWRHSDLAAPVTMTWSSSSRRRSAACELVAASTPAVSPTIFDTRSAAKLTSSTTWVVSAPARRAVMLLCPIANFWARNRALTNSQCISRHRTRVYQVVIIIILKIIYEIITKFICRASGSALRLLFGILHRIGTRYVAADISSNSFCCIILISDNYNKRSYFRPMSSLIYLCCCLCSVL